MRALDGPACAPCLAARGRRFVELAERFRNDPDFARLVLSRMSERQLEMMRRYWIGPPSAPPRIPRSPFDPDA
jgi:hypothetical protein